MLKVLQLGKFYYPYMGGIENHLQNLCKGLDGQVQVEVLVLNERNETVTETVDGVKVTRAGSVAEIASTPICPGLPGLLSKASYDILHVHLPNPTGVMACLTSRSREAGLVVTYHADIVKQKALNLFYSPFQKRFLSRADRIIATSPNYLATSEVLQQHKEKCVPIPYGIDPDLTSRADEQKIRELRERYGPRFLLGCGRLVYYKGFEVLIEAMADIDAHLVIVGQGPLQGKLEEMIARANLGDRVTLLGEVMNWEMVNYYAACDMFVLPSVSRGEAFAIVQLEAMAFGKPVVNTSLDSGVPFVSQDGLTGVTVPPRDAGALSGAIRSLLEDPARMRDLGERGRERFRKEFVRPVMVERVLEVYREVAGR
jgi:rhamnosyl/mannosyltransferase